MQQHAEGEVPARRGEPSHPRNNIPVQAAVSDLRGHIADRRREPVLLVGVRSRTRCFVFSKK